MHQLLRNLADAVQVACPKPTEIKRRNTKWQGRQISGQLLSDFQTKREEIERGKVSKNKGEKKLLETWLSPCQKEWIPLNRIRHKNIKKSWKRKKDEDMGKKSWYWLLGLRLSTERASIKRRKIECMKKDAKILSTCNFRTKHAGRKLIHRVMTIFLRYLKY